MVLNIHKSKNKKGNRKDAARLVRYPAGKTKEHAHKGEPEKDSKIKFLGSNMDLPDPTTVIIDGQLQCINCKDADWTPFVDRLNEQINKNDSAEYPLKHFSISLAEGENMSQSWWHDRYQEFMDRMGYEHCPHVSWQHNDTNLEHIHITATTIQDLPGNPVVDQWKDKERGMAIMRDFEKRYGLTVVCDPEDGKTINNADRQTVKADLRAKIDFVLNQQTTNGQAALPDFIKALNHYGVGASIQFQNGAPKGISYSYKGSSWAGGKLGGARRYALPGLCKADIDYDEARDKGRLELLNATEDTRRKGVAPQLKIRKLPADAASNEPETQLQPTPDKVNDSMDLVGERVRLSDGQFWIGVTVPFNHLQNIRYLSRKPYYAKRKENTVNLFYLCKNKGQYETMKMIESVMKLFMTICDWYNDVDIGAERAFIEPTNLDAYDSWKSYNRYTDEYPVELTEVDIDKLTKQLKDQLVGLPYDGGGGGTGMTPTPSSK